MQIQTLSSAFEVANRGGNSTAGSIVEPAAFAALSPGQNPKNQAVTSGVTSVGDGVIALGNYAAEANNSVVILPYGAGSSTQTFTLKAYAWDVTIVDGSTYALWVPYLLASFTCTLSTFAGVANTTVNASQLFCGTIALVTGNANVSNEILSPTGNVNAHIVLDTKGCQFMEFRYAMVTATSGNALVKKM